MNLKSNTIREELKILGDALFSFFAIEIILGHENRVATPSECIVLSVIAVNRQSTNETHYPDRIDSDNEIDRADLMFSELVIQLDFYGVAAAINANAMLMLSRSELLLEKGITPLFSSNLRNLVFTNSEKQQEQRYSLDLTLQFNSHWLQSQDSAIQIRIDNFFNGDHL